jgi:hypothetical protein
MRVMIAPSLALIFAAGVVVGGRWQTPIRAQGFTVTIDCGVASAAQIRTTLYFGLSRPKGSVSELDWQIFLRDEVTRRFPDGLTVWQAEGQWQTPAGSIDREQSKVLLLVHADTPAARQSVQAVIQAYRSTFEQQSVLWESSRVCVAS